MKKFALCLLPAIVLFFASSGGGRADQFTQLQNSPNGYWVPSPTPPPVGYYPPPPGPGPYYGGPPPYYYGPGPYYYGPPVYFGFGFGFHHHHH